MATMRELIAEYEDSRELLTGRIKELRAAMKETEAADEFFCLKRRLRDLEQLRTELGKVLRYMQLWYGGKDNGKEDDGHELR